MRQRLLPTTVGKQYLNSQCLLSAIFVLFFTFFATFAFPQITNAQQTFHTVDSDGSGKSVQINKNRAKLSKLRHDVVDTQNKLREAGPQAKDAADNCDAPEKLRWNGTTWSCLDESDHHANPFAEQDLPDCQNGYVLTSTSTTALGCTAPDKGPFGPAPTWRMPNGGDHLQVQNPNGSWGSSVNIRGNSGDTYTWYTGAYGGCSETSCGPGTRTRVVECRENMYTTVADSKCAAPKPATSTSCHAGWSYAWTGWTSWSSCNSSCSQSRTRDCRRCDGTTVADSYCSGSASQTQSCSNGYSWRWGSWGSCSSSCTRTRNVRCADSCLATVPDANCGGGKPATSQSCSGGYSWSSYGSYSSWSSCNSSCQQTRSRSRTCRRNCDNAVVSAGNCSGSTTQTQTQSCTGGYYWTSYSSWSSCSASCGGGTQSRSRSCKKRCNNATVSSGYCSGSATQSQSCNTQSCGGGGGGYGDCCTMNLGADWYTSGNNCVNKHTGQSRPRQMCY